MAEPDLDIVIRRIAKQQHKSLMEAARKRRDHLVALAAAASSKATKDRYRLISKNTMLHAAATAKRLQISAENAADSYARSMKKAAEEPPPKSAKKSPKNT